MDKNLVMNSTSRALTAFKEMQVCAYHAQKSNKYVDKLYAAMKNNIEPFPMSSIFKIKILDQVLLPEYMKSTVEFLKDQGMQAIKGNANEVRFVLGKTLVVVYDPEEATVISDYDLEQAFLNARRQLEG